MIYIKTKRKTKLTIDDIINEIAPYIVECGNKNKTYYKIVYDEVCNVIFNKYEIDDDKEFYSKLWCYFYNHNIQYHNKYAYLNNDKLFDDHLIY